jgi:hypothetical protein
VCTARPHRGSFEVLKNEFGSSTGFKPQVKDVTPEGSQPSSSDIVEIAVQRVLRQLYPTTDLPTAPVTDYTPEQAERNEDIFFRFLAGEPATQLAEEYGISLQRVYAIIRNYRFRNGQ